MTNTKPDTSAEAGFDYTDPEVLARQNEGENAACHIDGVFYDLRNAVHEITTLRAQLATARNAALDEAADRIRYMPSRDTILLAEAIRSLKTNGDSEDG